MWFGFKATIDKMRASWQEMTFFRRLLINGVVTVAVIGSVFWTASSYLFTAEMEARIKDILRHDLRMAREYYFERGHQMRLGMEQAAAQPYEQLMIKEGRKNALRELMAGWKYQWPYVDLLMIVDAEQRVITRLDNDASGDEASFNGLIGKALTGEVVLSPEILSTDEILSEGLIDRVPTIDGAGMTLLAVVPVKMEGEVVGAIVAGDLLNGDPYVPNRARTGPHGEPYQSPMIEAFQPLITICQGRRIVSPPEMLGEDCGVSDEKALGGESFKSAYVDEHKYHMHDTIRNNKGEVVGYLTVNVPESAIADMRRPLARLILVFGGGGTLLGIFIIFRNARLVSEPVKKLTAAFQRVAEGDLSHRISETFHGELGRLAQSFDETTEKLELSYKMLSTCDMAIKNAGDAIILTDAESRIVDVNLAFERITGYSREEILGQRLPSRRFGELPRALIEEMSHDLGEKGYWSGEVVRRKKDGTTFEAEVTVSRVVDHEGVLLGFVAVYRDHTERNRMQKQLVRADRLSSMGIMAADIVHEVKNPLNIVSLQAQMLAMEPDLEKHGEALNSIKNQMERAATILDKLRRFSREERVLKAPQDISTLVETTLSTIEPALISADVRVKKQLPPLGPSVSVSKEQMEQVLVNLCMNARDAMPQGGVLAASTGLAEDGNYFIKVADTGCGIPEGDLDKIFDPFYSTKPPEKGTGIGLSIVASIIQEHDGKIEVESAPGSGTTFTVKLPPLSESVREFEKEMELLTKRERATESFYAELAAVTDDPGLKDFLTALVGDESEHAKAIQGVVAEVRGNNWAQLPPKMGISGGDWVLPSLDPERASSEAIIQAVVEAETSSMNTFHHKLLYHYGAEKRMRELVDGHLGRVKDGVREFSTRVNLLDRVNRYVDELSRLHTAGD